MFYTGVTSNIVVRTQQHKSKSVKGFTQKYNLDQLVYIEKHEFVLEAIQREKTDKAMETRVEDKSYK